MSRRASKPRHDAHLHTATPLSPRAQRELLITLGAARELSRPNAYRLAATLDRWAASELGHPDVSPRELGVDATSLNVARALAPRAAFVAEAEEQRARELGAQIVTLGEEGYPHPLCDLALPPPVLYVRGTLSAGPAVTMVGARRADLYGLDVATLFARELAAAGVTVVSGFAQGVDLAAHRGALSAERGRTVAVLGCGLAIDYPCGHRQLADQIAEHGALISEFPPDTPPASWQFPVRNRILAALSQGTLVVRARARSGSLITARHALELGRDVYAIPGRIFEEVSVGPNSLIREGAHLVQHPREILEILGLEAVEETPTELLPEAAHDPLLKALPPAEPRAAEELATALKKSLPETMALLLEAELAGRVRRLPGGSFARRIH